MQQTKKKKNCYILGIETSCDETAAAIVDSANIVIANEIASQADLHHEYGGVVPEIASRLHIEAIIPVIDAAMKKAALNFDDLAALSVTVGPGLSGALLVGVSAAKALAAALNKPLVPIHHLAGHIAANYLATPELKPPFLCLLVSGAHSHLVLVEAYEKFKIIGRTRDDAAGEAFDKISRAICLGYPGGPLIEKIAINGNPHAFPLPKGHIKNSLDFSFSGLKTASLNYLNKVKMQAEQQKLAWEELLSLADFAATFQMCVAETLVENTEKALKATGVKTIALAGGVAANTCLRRKIIELAEKNDLNYSIPPLDLCTDNAAMIAAAGYFGYCNKRFAEADLNAYPSLELDNFEEVLHKNSLQTEDSLL